MRRLNPILGLLAVSFMGTAHAQQSGEVRRVVHPSHPVAERTDRRKIRLRRLMSPRSLTTLVACFEFDSIIPALGGYAKILSAYWVNTLDQNLIEPIKALTI